MEKSRAGKKMTENIPSRNIVMIKNESKEDENEISKTVHNVILENDIELKNAYKNKSGHLILECDSAEICKDLKQLVQSAKDDIEVNVPKAKMCAISIVGLQNEMTTSEFERLLIAQNPAVKTFSIRLRTLIHI